MSTVELFTRLYYFGTVQLRMNADDFWLTPIGLFLDLFTSHKQFELGGMERELEESADGADELGDELEESGKSAEDDARRN